MGQAPEQQRTADSSVDRSWRRYGTLAPDTTELAYETDADGVISWISPSVQDVLGWPPEDLVGTSARDLIHPLDRDRIDALRAALYDAGEDHDDVTCMVSTASGSYRQVRLTTRARLDEHGTVTGAHVMVTIAHDTDSALRALITLSRANHALLRAVDEEDLLQRMCDTIVEAGRYLFTWYGRPVDDAEQSVRPIALAGDHQGYLDEIRVSWGDNPLGHGPTGRCLRTGQTQVENDFMPDPDYRPWLAAATRRGFRSSIVLPITVSGRIDGALMVYATEPGAFDALARDLLEDLAADIGLGLERLRGLDELRRTTREAQDQRERLQATLDSMIDPFTILEGVRDDTGRLVDLRYVMANQAAVDYNRIPRDRLIGSRLLDLFPGQLEHGPLQEYFRTIETGEPVILDDYAYGHEILAEERRYDIRAVRSGDGIALTWRDVTDRHLAAQLLADSEQRYRLLAENSSDVILLSDQDTLMTWVSASSRQTLGWDPAELVGHTALEFIHPDDQQAVRDAVARSTRPGEIVRPQYRWRRPDGSYRWMAAAGQPIADDGSGRSGRVVSLRDIDAQVRAERDLAAREERYRLLAENASDVVWQVAPDGTLEWTSPSVTPVLGWSADAIVGTVAMDLIHPDDRARAIQGRREVLAGGSFQGEYRLLRADGQSRWMALSAHPVQTASGLVRILALRDIDDEVGARTQLEFALGHDQTTGLPGREGMLDRISFAQTLLGSDEVLAVLCIGVDALGEVNEAISHSAGDIVLRNIAARIAQSSPSPELVGRGAGDEFIVIVPGLIAGVDAAEPAERIRLAIHGPIPVAQLEISPTASIGIAIGDRRSDGDTLLRDAALALRQAKAAGRDRCAFVDAAMAGDAENRLALEVAMREGLRTHDFVPWFQPIVSLATAQADGYEALVRWQRGAELVLPDTFIPIAARSSLLAEIDMAMVDQVVGAMADMPEHMFVAINVSGETLTRTAYAEHVTARLAAHGVAAARLHIEVTETTLLSLNDDVVRQMEALAGIGCRWYVDDFGTGYSSISHLRDLPVAGLKLDRSFTSGIDAGDRTSMQLAGALIGLANGLGLDTVAEGIETQAANDYLRTLGWRHGQGWLFGRAVPMVSGSVPPSGDVAGGPDTRL